MPAAPQLGYGQRAEAPIDQVNVWMRGQPWYQQLLQSFGQNPNNVHLNDTQKQQVIRAAQANGVVVDEGHNGQEVDNSGNFQAKSHALRNTLIVAGVAAAALATMGAAGVFSAAAPAAASGTAATTTAGTLGSTVLGTGMLAPIAGGTGLAAGAGTAAGAGLLSTAGHFLASPAGSTLASTLGGVFTNIYGANKQADAARYGVDAQTAAAKYSADLQDAAAQRAEAFSRQQAQTGWQSGEQTQHANYDQWAARQRAITSSLGQQLGINYQLPDYVPGIDPHYVDGASSAPTGSGPSPAAPASGGNAAALKALLDGGLDPQTAVAKFNQQYGRTTGNEAVYYDPSKHGGVAAIGLPDAYLAKPGASWDITTRGGSGAAAPKAPGTLATFATPAFMTTPRAALPTPYQPGTLGAYFGRA